MIPILDIPSQALFGQLLIGLINGSFYAVLSLGLAVIYGLLKIANFTHGAQYMLGAFVSWLLLTHLGLGYWWALILAPLIVAATGVVIEMLLLRRIYKLDHLYGFLLTLGLALLIEGPIRQIYGSTGLRYSMPELLTGGYDLGFMYLPLYRGWVIVGSLLACVGTWFLIERTKLGALLRASTENPSLVQAFGINVPRLITLTYALGVGLAALAGVMAAPIYQVSPQMGSNMIIIVFAVVVIGGMGSIMGAAVSGFVLGIIEGLTKVIYPEASSVIIFVIMAIVLLVRPQGLFGQSGSLPTGEGAVEVSSTSVSRTVVRTSLIAAAVLLLAAPAMMYPVFLMKALLFALFAAAFNLLLGFVGLLSFGHAAFFGGASYVTAHATKMWGMSPELGILTGTAAAAVLGLGFGWLAIRRQGIYFAMVTLALAEMVHFYSTQARNITGGEDGIQKVPRGMLFGIIDLNDTLNMYYLVVAVFVIGYFIIYRTVHSPFGQVLKAIRENEPRAISLGYNTDRYKLVAFVISAALTGLAGSTKALVFQFASLTDVHWSMSGEVVLMTLIGGLGTVLGPVVGAFFITTMENMLSGYGAWLTLVQGAIFVICVLAFRRGIVGELGRLFRSRAAAPAQPRTAGSPIESSARPRS